MIAVGYQTLTFPTSKPARFLLEVLQKTLGFSSAPPFSSGACGLGLNFPFLCSMLLFFIRLTKMLFIRLQLFRLFSPLTGVLLKLAYLTRLSEWANQHKNITYNDTRGRWDYNKRYPMYKWVINHESLSGPINYMEFGVAQARSFNWFMQENSHPESRFHGFDTFEGLPEDFGPYKKGAFSNNNSKPVIEDQRGRFYQGLFQQTLPNFLESFDGSRRNVVMMDADLWSSSLYVLSRLQPFLKKGDIIFFDEFAVPTHEFKAYLDFIESTYTSMDLIAAANNYYFVAFKIS